MSSLLTTMTGRMKYVTDHRIQSYDRPEIFYQNHPLVAATPQGGHQIWEANDCGYLLPIYR
jgi:hypothetical protein